MIKPDLTFTFKSSVLLLDLAFTSKSILVFCSHNCRFLKGFSTFCPLQGLEKTTATLCTMSSSYCSCEGTKGMHGKMVVVRCTGE